MPVRQEPLAAHSYQKYVDVVKEIRNVFLSLQFHSIFHLFDVKNDLKM